MGHGVGNEIVEKGADYETLRNSKATLNGEFHLERGWVSLLSTPTVSSVPGEYNLGKRSVNHKFAQISNE